MVPIRSGALTVGALAVGLLTASGASAYEPPYDFYSHPKKYELRVHPDAYWCGGEESGEFCSTELVVESPLYWENGDDGGYAMTSAELTNVASGKRIAVLTTPSDISDRPTVITGHTNDGVVLPAGTYRYRVDWYRFGYWSCSIYDPNGCSWNDEERATFQYKFRYDGQTPITALPYRPPFTEVRQGYITRGYKDARKRTTEGRVFSATERKDFSLTRTRAQAHRRVLVQRSSDNRHWKTFKRGYTKKDGRYFLAWRTKSAKSRYFYRVSIPAKGTSPSVVVGFRGGRFRVAAPN